MAKKRKEEGREEDSTARKSAAGRAKAKAPAARKFVYFFGSGKAEGNRHMKDTLGGKGSGLAEMTNAGLPVPPGFTISTAACNLYYELGGKVPAGRRHRDRRRTSSSLEKAAGATLGSTENPLLVSVRSGAKFSMPGHDGHHPEPRPERRGGRGAEAPHVERPVRLRQLPPIHADVRLGGAGDPEVARSSTSSTPSRRPRACRSTRISTRLRCARSSRRYKAVVRKHSGKPLPAGSERAAEDGAQRRVPLVEQPAREGVSPHLRHPGLDRHRRQRADDGVRQHRRPVGHRRGLHAQPGDRRQGVLRRVPDQRPGRGRGRRHPHAAAHQRARQGDAEGLRAAAADHDAAREALQGHPGLRVHDPGRSAVHAADAERQAHRLCCGRHRDRSGEGAPRHAEGGDCCWSIRRRCRSCSRRGSIRRSGRASRWPPAGCPPRRAPPADRWCLPPTRR